MNNVGSQTDSAPSAEPEAAAEKQRRIVCEAKEISEVRASVAAGYYATSAEVKAWIDSLATDRPLPVPTPSHSRVR